MRKWKHLIRCVKNWNGRLYGWWAWSEGRWNWFYTEENKVEWLLCFLPANERPTLEEIRAEAFADVVVDPRFNTLVFIDREFMGDFDYPRFTAEELEENERLPLDKRKI